MSSQADYLTLDDTVIDPLAKVREKSRRARGFAFYATVRHLGRRGIDELVRRSCARALDFAEQFGRLPGVTVLNEVVLNQVLVAFDTADPAAIAADVRSSGTAFVTPSAWRGEPVLRISVSGWRTDEEDVRARVQAIARALDIYGAARRCGR